MYSWKLCLIPLAALICIIMAQRIVASMHEAKIAKLEQRVLTLTQERDHAASEKLKAEENIERVNALLKKQSEEITTSQREAERVIARLQQEASTEKIKVIKELVKDPSCENQVRLITEAQRRLFYD